MAADANQYYNGLEQGTDFADEIDAGGNLSANELMRKQNYGRPLNQTETRAAYVHTIDYVAQQNRSQNAYQRYLAVSNPDSLLTRFGMGISGVNMSSFRSLLNPGHLFASAFSRLSPKASAAIAADPKSLDYGNVQWGWADSENKLISSASYQMLENQRILDDSGKEDEIADKYDKCFSASMGTLLQEGDIVRDQDGSLQTRVCARKANSGLTILCTAIWCSVGGLPRPIGKRSTTRFTCRKSRKTNQQPQPKILVPAPS